MPSSMGSKSGVKAKTHFFKNLNLNTVLEGSGETASFTGGYLKRAAS